LTWFYPMTLILAIKDDPKIIQVLLKWEHKIPPNWSDLWVEALKKYEESLMSLKRLLG
jgi:hypothetical protein